MPEPIAGENLRFQVENLGRIAHADVEIRPLTLFVGENNSGKSYLATAVWAIHSVSGWKFERPEAPAWQASVAEMARVLKALSSHPNRGDHQADEEVEAPEVNRASLGAMMWEHLEALIGLAIPDLLPLALPGLVGSPRLTVCLPKTPTDPQATPIELTRLRSSLRLSVRWPTRGRTSRTVFPTRLNSATQAALRLMLATRLLGALGFTATERTIRYLPASRTGYVHLLPSIADQVMSANADGDPSILSQIPKPTDSFFRFLLTRRLGSSDEGTQGRNRDLLELLEKQILGGRFVESETTGGASDLRYVPAGSEVAIPIALTSSLVSELMPFALALTERAGMLIYEEPEAHLHPRLQRVLAQILVRLVRRGTKVLVTTHSDTFVQQINNFLKRGALGEDAPGGADYGPEDMLRVEDVAAYEFQFRPDGLTEVIRAEVVEEGMILPTFNRELISLTEETVELNERLEARRRS